MAHAIVIGIDNYLDPSMRLKSAVSDACEFARWARREGGVAPADLTLMLAPLEGATVPPELGTPLGATRRDINRVLSEYTNDKRGLGADRLYFYFAGHGLAGAAAAHVAKSEPVIVPANYEKAAYDANLLLGFSDLIPLLRAHPPREQIFFIDACRDYAPDGLLPAPGQAVMYVPPPSLDLQASQCVLYGTSLGRKAIEHDGSGIFTAALLEALRGSRVDLTYSYERSCFRLRFEALATSIAEVVRQRAGGAQIPEPRFLGDGGLVMVDLGVDTIPMVDVNLLLQPREFGESCEVELLEFSMAKRDLVVTVSTRADATSCASLRLTPGTYALRVHGPRGGAVTSLRVRATDGVQRVPVRLEERVDEPVAYGIEADLPGLESIAIGPPVSKQSATGVVVTFADPSADIVLYRGTKELGRARSKLELEALTPNVYTVTIEPSRRSIREDVVVLEGEITTCRVRIPDDSHDRPDLRFLERLGVTTEKGFVRIAGIDTPLADPPLTEVLALLARAHARWDPPGSPRSRILVIVAAPDDPACVKDVGVAIERTTGSREVLETRDPYGAAAVIFDRTIDAGLIEIRLDLPGIVQTNIAAVAIEGDTLAVIVELQKGAMGRAGIVHLAQVGSSVSLQTVRDFDRAQHALRSSPTLGPAMLARALNAAKAVPLFALLVAVNLDPREHNAELVLLTTSLTDVPALAGTADLALLRGEPQQPALFAVTAKAARLHDRVVGRELLPAATWATWLQERPTLIDTQPFAKAPPSWSIVERHRAEIELVLPAVGIVLSNGIPVATCFLVGPDCVMTVSFVADDAFTRGQLAFRFEARSYQAVRVIASNPRSFVALVRLDRAVGNAQPLQLAGCGVEVDQPRPAYLPALNATTLTLAVHPGLIVARRNAVTIPIFDAPEAGPLEHDILVHDCGYTRGSAGAPLIDLVTGKVIGLHHSGELGLVKTGIATLLTQPMLPRSVHE